MYHFTYSWVMNVSLYPSISSLVNRVVYPIPWIHAYSHLCVLSLYPRVYVHQVYPWNPVFLFLYYIFTCTILYLIHDQLLIVLLLFNLNP
jgi:hypothetical protein